MLELLFEHALVGVDLSKVSDSLIKWLVSLKSIETKRLSLVHVIPLELIEHVAGFAVDKLLSELRREALEKLEEYSRFLESEGFLVDFKVLGPAVPAKKLAEEAEKLSVDYIVVASRGHGWLRELLMGSTVEELLRVATRSVLVSKPYKRRKGEKVELVVPPSPFLGLPILAAVEFDEYLDSVLSCGVELAKRSKGELVMVHVAEDGEDSSYARERLARLARSISGDVSVRYEVLSGRPHKVIVELVDKMKVGLAIIGGKPGSVLEYVAKRSPVHVFACK